MKVLLTATVQSHICQFHRPLVQMLREHGCEVHVAARDNLAEKNGMKLDFVQKVYDVPFFRSPADVRNIRAFRQLQKILDAEHYDIIHCNTPVGGVATRLAARKARKQGTQVFYTAHGFHFYSGAPKKNWMIYYPVEKLLSRMTDRLITINQEDYALAKERFPSDCVRIHGVGVDASRYYPASEEERRRLRQEMGFSRDRKIILCIGELLPNKNQAMAIRMMQRLREKHPDAVLLIAGNGPEKERLEQMAADAGVGGQVGMLGYCTCLEKYQQIADVLVSCSGREGLPLNIVEAMLSGNPVVATENRGHRELIRHGHNGFLVDRDDTGAMAEYVDQLLRDAQMAAAMGAEGRKIAQDYSAAAVKRELERIYFGI